MHFVNIVCILLNFLRDVVCTMFKLFVLCLLTARKWYCTICTIYTLCVIQGFALCIPAISLYCVYSQRANGVGLCVICIHYVLFKVLRCVYLHLVCTVFTHSAQMACTMFNKNALLAIKVYALCISTSSLYCVNSERGNGLHYVQ